MTEKIRKLENGKVVVETTKTITQEFTEEELDRQIAATETKLVRLRKSKALFK